MVPDRVGDLAAEAARGATGQRRTGSGRVHALRVTDWRLDELLHHAADMGVDVEYADLSARSRRGEWRWWCRTIVLHRGLTTAQMVCSLAHEIAHVTFGDTCSTPAAERRAWEYAAAVLVTPEEYRDAEALFGPHAGALAKELGVTVRLVEAWRRWWLKTGRHLSPESLRFPFEDDTPVVDVLDGGSA